MQPRHRFLIAATALVFPATAFALDAEYVPTDATIPAPAPVGWRGKLDGGFSFNVGHNGSVVGQTDGATWTGALTLNAQLEYLQGPHELHNTLTLTEAQTKTPVLDDLVKSSDALTLESLYYYHLAAVPWLGPFGRLRLETAVLPGVDVRAADVTYVGAANRTSDTLHLTDAFAPLFLKESAGLFAQPWKEPTFALDARLGAGGRQVMADGQLVLADDSATPEIEVGELTSYQQAGAEATLEAQGGWEEDHVHYKLTAEALAPLVDTSAGADDRSLADSTDVETTAALSFKMVAWASLDYQFKAARLPALLDDWQVSHAVMVTFRSPTLQFGRWE